MFKLYKKMTELKERITVLEDANKSLEGLNSQWVEKALRLEKALNSEQKKATLFQKKIKGQAEKLDALNRKVRKQAEADLLLNALQALGIVKDKEKSLSEYQVKHRQLEDLLNKQLSQYASLGQSSYFTPTPPQPYSPFRGW